VTNRCDLLFGFMLVEASGFAAVTMALGQGLSGVSDGIWVMPLITVLGIMVAEFAFRLVEWRFGLKRADPRGEPE
jgi:hypothetical protein